MAAVHNHPPHTHCCHEHVHQPSISEQVFKILEKVSAIALGIFAAYASMELFLSFLLLGTAVGLYQHFSSTSNQANSSAGTGCSQGFLEQLTGVKLPPLISLGANLAVTWCHIDHHTDVFVPIIALSLGAWAGQSLGSLASRVCPAPREATA
jgi:hypothetical protein